MIILYVCFACQPLSSIWKTTTKRRQLKSDPQTIINSISNDVRYKLWHQLRPTFQVSIILSLIICGVAIIQTCVADYQTLGHSTISKLGLNVPLASNGEIWRLITCVFLHENLAHLSISVLVAIFLGRQLAKVSVWTDLPLVFVVSAAFGIMFHMIDSESADFSVGPSGAICGFIGYLFIFLIMNLKLYPPKLLANVCEMIIILSVYIIVAARFNYSHILIGGFIGGVITALIICSTRQNNIPQKPRKADYVICLISFLLILSGAIFTSCMLLGLDR